MKNFSRGCLLTQHFAYNTCQTITGLKIAYAATDPVTVYIGLAIKSLITYVACEHAAHARACVRIVYDRHGDSPEDKLTTEWFRYQ